jgi:hypothetical protein
MKTRQERIEEVAAAALCGLMANPALLGAQGNLAGRKELGFIIDPKAAAAIAEDYARALVDQIDGNNIALRHA